jgi:Tol biopolymer transport system component
LSAPSPSADGRYVAYARSNVVYVWDAQTASNVVASVNQSGLSAPSREGPSRPILSADGSKVCFLSDVRLTAAPTNGLAQLYQRDLVAGTTVLLSVDTNSAASGDLSAIVPSMIADGGIVAFETTSSTMVPDDFNLAPDVFVRDLVAGTLALMSGRDSGLPSSTPVAEATLYPNSISADGRYVAYGSLDNGLFAGDTNGVQDLFVRDLVNGTVEPVNASATGAFTNQFPAMNCVLSADGRHVAWVVGVSWFLSESSVFWRDLQSAQTRTVSDAFPFSYLLNGAPTISPDGRWVAFETTKPAYFFEPGMTDVNSGSDVVLQDVLAGTNVVISRSLSSFATGSGASSSPQFSPDGRWLAFASRATDLTSNSVSGLNLLVRDLVNHTTYVVSFGAGMPMGYVSGASFSRDSRFLAYNAPSSSVGLYDLVNKTVTNVCMQCRNPTLSGDGRLLAAEAYSPFAGGWRVLLMDRLTGINSVIGTNIMSGAFIGSTVTYNPVLSADGRYLVFLATRPYDTPADTLPRPSLYLRDLARGVTMALPIDGKSGSGNGSSYVPQLAANGRTLVFASFASDLVSGDFNSRRDIFTLQIGSPDTDGDGLDDDWEVAFFGDLSRDGSGDFDQDGQSDRAEFLSGTDPTNTGSVLRVMILASTGADAVTVLWSSVPGRTYDVQYKDTLTEDWSTLYSRVAATSATRSVVDNVLPRPLQRFYRVLFVP